MARKLLTDLPLYRNALAYYKSLKDCHLSAERAAEVEEKIAEITLTVKTAEAALDLLSPVEREVITKFYLEGEKSLFDVCESCSMERSTIYRYRSLALYKIAKAVYGAE